MPFICTRVNRETSAAQRYAMLDGIYPLLVCTGTPVEKLCSLATPFALQKKGLCF